MGFGIKFLLFFLVLLHDVLSLLKKELVNDDRDESAKPREDQVNPCPIHAAVLYATTRLEDDSDDHA